ncbi:hypothetical protein [Streptomyces sp. NPDC087317]
MRGRRGPQKELRPLVAARLSIAPDDYDTHLDVDLRVLEDDRAPAA